jgi:hypothetical protein
MKSLILAVIFLSVVANCRAIEWRHDDIRVSVQRDDSKPTARQFLQFERQSADERAAWRLLPIEVPAQWQIAKVDIDEDGFAMKLRDGRLFRVRHYDLGALHKRLVDETAKGGSLISKIWGPYERTG